MPLGPVRNHAPGAESGMRTRHPFLKRGKGSLLKSYELKGPCPDQRPDFRRPTFNVQRPTSKYSRRKATPASNFRGALFSPNSTISTAIAADIPRSTGRTRSASATNTGAIPANRSLCMLPLLSQGFFSAEPRYSGWGGSSPASSNPRTTPYGVFAN